MKMQKYLDNIYKNQSLIYKSLVYCLAVFVIVFLFPKGGKFKYDYQKGKPWQYENLYAPFDFAIQKTAEDIALEKQQIQESSPVYFTYNDSIVSKATSDFWSRFNLKMDTLAIAQKEKEQLRNVATSLLARLYIPGILQNTTETVSSQKSFLVKGNEAVEIVYKELIRIQQVPELILEVLAAGELETYHTFFKNLCFDVIAPNVFFNERITQKERRSELAKLSLTRGAVDEGKLIIARGEVVEAENYKILNSLKEEYASEVWTANNYYLILTGYTVLVALVLLMLFLFLKKYRIPVFANHTKVTFIFFNILLMVLFTTLVIKYNEGLLYAVPLCILPLILKTFFDARLGLFVHVLTVLILGFVVPNSFEYIFLQIMAGIVTILSVSQLYKRANLFISVGQITFIYMIGYFAFYMIHEGSLEGIHWQFFAIFLLNGMLTLFVQPLIYMYEKIFGLVSDVSLLELSDTNSALLKELSDKAPGTFHHSLQVANLAEAAANAIGANALLVRVGALYHDIGKMVSPTYFTENQITSVNPHDELTAKDSAKVIIDHVLDGIGIARKNNLPDRVIDFIRVHHGTSMVHYFYRQAMENDPEVNEDDFRYPGPIPFSKETAILMMSDAVEAASKSLKNPTYTIIDSFVEKIIAGQMSGNQFLNANITFKEIEIVKKVLKQKLTNIYHLRVEYPD